MRLLFLLTFPMFVYSQPVANFKYYLKEVHAISLRADSSVKWKADTIKYHVPFEIKFTKAKVAIDGYGTYKIIRYEDRSHEGTQIDHWVLSDKSTITKFDNLMYWEYPFVNKKSKFIYFKIE